jgi:hypothetical protein
VEVDVPMATELMPAASWEQKIKDAKVIPDEMASLFHDPPLLDGEDELEYLQIVGQLATAVSPVDYIDWLHLRDAADELWDAQRYRRIKANALTAANARTIEGYVLAVLTDQQTSKGGERIDDGGFEQLKRKAQKLTWAWLAKGEEGEQQVNELFKTDGVDLKVLCASHLAEKIEFIERLEKMTLLCDAHRNDSLREIERRRTARRVTSMRSSAEIVEQDA